MAHHEPTENFQAYDNYCTANSIISAVVGSKAYHIDTPDSDTDVHGIFIAPPNELFSIHGYTKCFKYFTNDNRDVTYFEVGKFVGLAQKCNPTALEILWSPYCTTMNSLGNSLRGMGRAFLAHDLVCNAYRGFAHGENKAFLASVQKDTTTPDWKSAAHALRILVTGAMLLETGELHIEVPAKIAEYLKQLRNGNWPVEMYTELFNDFFEEFERWANKKPSVLPVKIDTDSINAWLLQARLESIKQWEENAI